MQFHKLMVQHPFGVHGVLRHPTAGEFPGDVPITDKMVKERVKKLITTSRAGNENVIAQRMPLSATNERLIAGMLSDFHLSRDSGKAKVFG